MSEADFSKPQFEHLMRIGVRYYNKGRFYSARHLHSEARALAPPGSMEEGRAARDEAADLDRLGQRDLAAEAAQDAFEIHDALVESLSESATADEIREAYRERSVSAMRVGVSGLRRVIAGEESASAESVREHMRLTWSDLEVAKSNATGAINRRLDQYEINAARRVSAAESLVGSRWRGLKIGLRAAAIGLMSESPRLDTAEPDLTRAERLRAKGRAVAGGLAAVGVATSVSIGMQKPASKLADKLI